MPSLFDEDWNVPVVVSQEEGLKIYENFWESSLTSPE